MSENTTLRILIVDDDEDSRDVYRTYLHARGYEVLVAEDGAEGRRLLTDGEPHAVVLDRRLPDMDGLELLGDVVSGTPVICVSARAFEEDRAEALAAGAASYLPKPVTPRTVLEEVERLLDLDA